MVLQLLVREKTEKSGYVLHREFNIKESINRKPPTVKNPLFMSQNVLS